MSNGSVGRIAAYVIVFVFVIPIVMAWQAFTEIRLSERSNESPRGGALEGPLERYRAAARKGNPEAQYNLALALMQDRRQDEAIPWLIKAADHRYLPEHRTASEDLLGNIFLEKRQYAQAYSWFLKLRQNPEASSAATAVGLFKGCGFGTRRDVAGSIPFLMRSGPGGAAEKFANLLYAAGEISVSELSLDIHPEYQPRWDEGSTARWRSHLAQSSTFAATPSSDVRQEEAAAREGNADALFRLGRLYDEGRYVRRDPNAANRYYERFILTLIRPDLLAALPRTAESDEPTP